mmetsp:Transcript_57427/g.178471  ORF Transcript_57427/g.178471 Transcript_57427/m.178471 type:complete len:542 (+) Transcript_57427:145-1770(+)
MGVEDGVQETEAASSSEPLNPQGKSLSYGSVPKHENVGIPAVCWYILIVELCERLSFYTFAGSQAFFLEHLGFSLASAGGLNATMWTLCTCLAVVASWAADVGLGRYNTILAAGITYFSGAAVAAIAAWPGIESSWLYFVGVMGLLPIATAGIKANISNFGADQYDPNDPGAAAAQERFFSIFYLSINVGAGVAYGFFTTFASSGGVGVPKAYGYFVAYALMALCMALAVCVYRAGRHGYKVHPLQERSALFSVAKALFDCARTGCWRAAFVCLGMWCLLGSIILSCCKALAPASGSAMMWAAFACAGIGTLTVVLPCINPSWLRAEGAEPTADQAEVQGFLRILPVLFTGNLAFGALYNSMQFWYQQQACQMDVRMPFGNGFQLSGSFFNIADCFAIVIVTPIAVDWINPGLERLLGGQLRHGPKFGVGMLVAAASVAVACSCMALNSSSEQLTAGRTASSTPLVSACVSSWCHARATSGQPCARRYSRPSSVLQRPSRLTAAACRTGASPVSAAPPSAMAVRSCSGSFSRCSAWTLSQG